MKKYLSKVKKKIDGWDNENFGKTRKNCEGKEGAFDKLMIH